MRLLATFIFFVTIQLVLSKNNAKALTESLGQEVIEIGAPIKDLPPDVEEEPSAENDEEDKVTTTTVQVATKKDFKKPASSGLGEKRRKNIDIDRNVLVDKKTDDEEARIEKELADLYKDNSDYKGDSSEEVKKPVPAAAPPKLAKPIARTQNNFKFQPDVTTKEEIEKFRTSVDDIDCSTVEKLSGIGLTTSKPSSGIKISGYFLQTIIPLFFVVIFK